MTKNSPGGLLWMAICLGMATKTICEPLRAKGVEVVASMVGEILTVQEAAGFQLNFAKWDEEFIRLWNTPCHTPAYSKE